MYLFIKCIEQEIYVKEYATKAEATTALINDFIGFHCEDSLLEEDELEMLEKGEFPDFEDGDANICADSSWSVRKYPYSYSSLIYEVKGCNTPEAFTQPKII